MKREKAVINRRRKIVLFIALLVMFAVGIPCGAYWKNKMIAENMTPMEDVYFVVYEGMDEPKSTIIYKYDAQTKTTGEIGRVPGYFYNCEIDSKKEYIIGLRGSLWNEEKPGADFGVVRFLLADKTSEVILSDEKMNSLGEGDIFWPSTYICDSGEKILIHYYNPKHIYILYDLTTGRRQEIDAPRRIVEFLDIKGDIIWYKSTNGAIIKYNMKTKEEKETIEHARPSCAISYDDEKIAFFNQKNNHNRIYMYDLESGEEKCMLRAGWNSFYVAYYQYTLNWDKSGNYFFYIEAFRRIVGCDVRIKYYNLKTGESGCIYKESNSVGRSFEFVRNADGSEDQ